ncbi:MAG: aminodeoxychorismate/anthranilate synthase component II [Planctomycetota bacterium]|nr:aminodeoxychorismate/anthranilate synthase component II [Planctomycetota bacterium]
MILVIDNYDSFVFNLARYVQQLVPKASVVVRRNDELDIPTVEQMEPEAIIISPGPCGPQQANQTPAVVEHFSGQTPMLGVCLGHQVIAARFGAEVVPSGQPMHGRSSSVFHDGHPVFDQIPSPFTAGRYHSLIIEPASLPDCLSVIARTEDGTIMAIAHRELPIIGYQFHPESVLTPEGYPLLRNFLRLAGLDLPQQKFKLSPPTQTRLSTA